MLPVEREPNSSPYEKGLPRPSIWTRIVEAGLPSKSACEVPSMIVVLVIGGRAVSGTIEATPVEGIVNDEGIAKVMVAPLTRSAFRIAWRSEPRPESFVL